MGTQQGKFIQGAWIPDPPTIKVDIDLDMKLWVLQSKLDIIDTNIKVLGFKIDEMLDRLDRLR